MAFMSDTANVMKGCRSGVQKLIKNEIPQLYDVGCICHLADMTIKVGMAKLPVDIDQLFTITSITALRGIKNFLIFGAPYLLLQSQKPS